MAYLYDEGSLQFTVTECQRAYTLPGDFNGDNVVDAGDYVVWRRTDGTPESYEAWRSNFGRHGWQWPRLGARPAFSIGGARAGRRIIAPIMGSSGSLHAPSNRLAISINSLVRHTPTTHRCRYGSSYRRLSFSRRCSQEHSLQLAAATRDEECKGVVD